MTSAVGLIQALSDHGVFDPKNPGAHPTLELFEANLKQAIETSKEVMPVDAQQVADIAGKGLTVGIARWGLRHFPNHARVQKYATELLVRGAKKVVERKAGSQQKDLAS